MTLNLMATHLEMIKKKTTNPLNSRETSDSIYWQYLLHDWLFFIFLLSIIKVKMQIKLHKLVLLSNKTRSFEVDIELQKFATF